MTNSNESLESFYSNSYGFANMIRLVDFQVYDEKPFCSSGQIGYDLTCQYMNRQVPIPCKIIFKNDQDNQKTPILLLKNFSKWITKDQYFVIYNKDEQVVASGRNLQTGPSLFEIRNKIFTLNRSEEFREFWSDVTGNFGNFENSENSKNLKFDLPDENDEKMLLSYRNDGIDNCYQPR